MTAVRPASILLLLATAKAQDSLPCPEVFWEEMHASLKVHHDTSVDLGTNDLAFWVGVNDPVYGEMYWTFGNATLDPDGTLASLQDHFEIGSISKGFGATVNLFLMESGDYPEYTLEATVQDLVPELALEFPEYANYTTLELMAMQTKVPDFLNDPNGMVADIVRDPTQRWSISEIVEFAMQSYPTAPDDDVCLGSEIGPECTAYSTTNILVMEYIAESVTGKTMQVLVRQLVLEPLEMKTPQDTDLPLRDSSGVRPAPEPVPYAAKSCIAELNSVGGNFTAGDSLLHVARSVVNFGSGGSMYSTISDLLKWASSGTGDDLLTPETLAKRHVYVPLGPIRHYGIGQYKLVASGEDIDGWYGHDGDSLGFSSVAYRHDEHEAAFAAAASTCSVFLDILGALQIYANQLNNRPANATLSQDCTAAPSQMPLDTDAPTTGPISTQAPTAGVPTTEAPSLAMSYSGVIVWSFLLSFAILPSVM